MSIHDEVVRSVPAIWNFRSNSMNAEIAIFMLVGPDPHHSVGMLVPSMGAAFRLLEQPFDEWNHYGRRDDACPVSEDVLTEAIHQWNEVHADIAEEQEHGHGWKWLGLRVTFAAGEMRGAVTMELNHAVGQVIVHRDAIDLAASKLLVEFVDRAKAVLK